MDWTDLARRQGGIIARSQLMAMGYTAFAVNGMLRRGRLERMHPERIYRVAGCPDTSASMRWVAVLATRSPLSYLSAAEAWAVPISVDNQLHITRFDRKRLVWPAGVRVHRVLLDRSAVTDRGGLPVTTRTETLLDCLGWLRISEARTLADRAKQQGWLSAADIECRLENQSGRWGNRQLRRLLSSFGDNAHSEAERRLHRLLREAGVFGWTANHAVTVAGARYVLDVAFPGVRIAIEIDGYGTHSGRDAFQGDRTKDVRLRMAGWTVLRFTWADLVERPRYVIAAITQLLAA